MRFARASSRDALAKCQLLAIDVDRPRHVAATLWDELDRHRLVQVLAQVFQRDGARSEPDPRFPRDDQIEGDAILGLNDHSL